MNIPYLNNMPLWIEILVMLLGLFFLAEGFYCIKRKKAFLPFIEVKKEKNSLAYWAIVVYWLGFGLFFLIIALLSMFLS